jgi:NagD protein
MEALETRLRELRHIVLDMDGTIYLGNRLFETTLPFLDALDDLGIGHTFISNNNSRSRADYALHLQGMGIPARCDQIFTSAHGTLAYFQAHLPQIARVFVLGMPGLVEDLEHGGLVVSDSQPEAVIVGFDRNLTYDRLAQTAYWITQGLPYVATHPDLVCPTDQPIVLPDCGAICALLQAATDRAPDHVPGKPDPAMLAGVMREQGVGPAQTAVVGDRIYTDMQMALDTGALAILTLTGEATAQQASQSPNPPDLVVTGLDDLADRLRSARN